MNDSSQKTDITKAIKTAEICSEVSKDGHPYTVLKLTMVNGYEHRVFVRGAELFALRDAASQVQTTEQLDSAF